MVKTKNLRVLITLECSECRLFDNTNKRKKGISRYLTEKNKRNTTLKLELFKYCAFCNKHTNHKEIK